MSPSRRRIVRISSRAWVVPLLLLMASEARARSDWPMVRGDAQNRGVIDLEAPQSPPLRPWTFEGSGRVWGYEPGISVWTSPAVGVVAGRAVVAVGSYDHNLYVLDAASGEVLWQHTTGDSILGTPALWDSGEGVSLFVTSSDRLVYALDAEVGRRLWIHTVVTFRPTLGGARLSAPCVGKAAKRDAVFFGHWVWDRSLAKNLQQGGVTALDARTGEVLWQRLLGDNEITAPVYADLGDPAMLFVGSSDGNLIALNAGTGQTLWTGLELDAIRSPPAVANHPEGPRVVSASKSGLVRCLDMRTGQELWKYRTGDWVTGSPAVGRFGARDLVFVGSYDRALYALDLGTGKMFWRYATRGGIYGSPAVVEQDPHSMVLTTSWDHHLHAASGDDGTALWQFYTGRPLWDTVGLGHSTWSSPVVAEINGDWLAFVGSYDGRLRALELSRLSGSRLAGRSNLAFWLSFPTTLAVVGLFALGLTRHHRRR